MTTKPDKTAALDRKERKDLEVLALFTGVYCKVHHDGPRSSLDAKSAAPVGKKAQKTLLCAECRDFLSYAFARRLKCPLNPKPTCKHCTVHCYRPGHRERVREIMRFSGKYLIRRGRFDLLWHYFF